MASGGLDISVSSICFKKSSINWPQQPLTERVSYINEEMEFGWSILQKGAIIGHLADETRLLTKTIFATIRYWFSQLDTGIPDIFSFFIWASKVVQSKRFKSLLQSIVVKRMKSCAHLNLHKTILVHVTGPPRCNIFYIILHISKKRIGMKYLISMHAITRP